MAFFNVEPLHPAAHRLPSSIAFCIAAESSCRKLVIGNGDIAEYAFAHSLAITLGTIVGLDIPEDLVKSVQ